MPVTLGIANVSRFIFAGPHSQTRFVACLKLTG
jgi:hypothetical protein